MATKQVVKRNLSSMQVLKTLLVLMEGNYTMNELTDKLNKDEASPIFNHSVISKYINTCRYLGIDIPKIHNKYFVASLPFGLNLDLRDLELFENLQNVAKEILPEKSLNIFTNFINKLAKYSNKQLVRADRQVPHKAIEMFDRAIQEKRKINLMFKNNTNITCIPVGIVENKGKTFFNIHLEEKEKLYVLDNIVGIEVLPQRFAKNYTGQVVVYTLTGNLVKRYELRENEQLISKEQDSITISNKGENKEILFSRLLRYDSSCEILHPKHYREEMKQLLNDMLKNYGV